MAKQATNKNMPPSAGRKLLPCPKCKSEVEDLLKIDVGMKLSLESEGHKDLVFAGVCPKCYTELSSMVSQGARLRAEKTSRDHNKKVLWKNRVDFLKQARNLMSIRAYPEAAVMYEKYMKSVAIGFECKPTEITPEKFKDPRFKKELTVMTYVLWDLFKIYDSNPKYNDRLNFVSQKLQMFALANNNIQADIARKLHNYTKFANNKKAVNALLKEIDNNIVRCFIATAAFENRNQYEVQVLCAFRDQILKRYYVGQIFIRIYYTISPKIAIFLDHNPIYKKPIQKILTKIAMRLNRFFDLLSI